VPAVDGKITVCVATVQRALRALYTEPYLEEGRSAFGGKILSVGVPTGEALRVAGAWPSPEGLLE